MDWLFLSSGDASGNPYNCTQRGAKAVGVVSKLELEGSGFSLTPELLVFIYLFI